VRLAKNQSGQVRIIEALFASMLLLSSLALIPSKIESGNSNEQELSSRALEILVALDSNGYLSRLVENRSWNVMTECLERCLSPATWFNMSVCDNAGHCLNDIQITNGSPINERIYSADYICVSQNGNFGIYIIRLQIAGVG
jgi:hypothetical protein